MYTSKYVLTQYRRLTCDMQAEVNMKERLDVILVGQGYAPSREKAKAIIMSGNVYVNGQKEDKAGSMFELAGLQLEVRGTQQKYVSRGGLKLEKAIESWGISLEGLVCMDIGASTGGFTDCMLQNGAEKVYSVDVGHGQLDWKLRNDPRVVCMEKTNFRYMQPGDVDETPDFASVDVSFISLTKILVPARNMERRLSGKHGLFVYYLRVYRNLLLVPAFSLETYHTIHQCEQCVVAAAAHVDTGMDFRPALSVKDISGQHELSVRSLGAQPLGLGISAVLRGADSLFMGK